MKFTFALTAAALMASSAAFAQDGVAFEDLTPEQQADFLEECQENPEIDCPSVVPVFTTVAPAAAVAGGVGVLGLGLLLSSGDGGSSGTTTSN